MIDRKILIRLNETSKIDVKKGLAKALLPEEISQYDSKITGKRDYDTAYGERILGPMEKGRLLVKNADGSIKFDDRKLRFSHMSISQGTPTIYVAPTTYPEMDNSDNRALSEGGFFNMLTEKGIKDYNDPFAYFSSAFAVNAVPVTNEGVVHVFRRGKETNAYPNYWHVLGGMLDTDFTLFDQGNPGENLLNNVGLCIKKEYSEEAGVKNGDFKLAGLTKSIPGTVDFNYIANLPMNSQEFLDSMDKAKDNWEHSGHMAFKSQAGLKTFLDQTSNIVPIGRGTLELYLEQKL